MKTFTEPELNILTFQVEDIITISLIDDMLEWAGDIDRPDTLRD